MSPADVQALRRLVFYSIEDAAQYLAASPQRPAGVEPRSWQAWERGDRRIPADVIAALENTVAYRAGLVRHYEQAVLAAPAGARVGFAWYATLADWSRSPVPAPQWWRPHCSALADLRARYPQVRLVAFDGAAYDAWRVDRPFAALHDEWATSTLDAAAGEIA